jgi:YidC/Oxa1 family membrane protein insertase
MEPKANRGNIVLFVVLSAVVLTGSIFLQTWLAPKKQDDEAGQKSDLAKKTEKGAEKKDAKAPAPAEQKAKPGAAKPPVTALPQPKPEYLKIGGSDFNLEGTLTTRGAGIVELTLTRFKAADRFGKPEDRPFQIITPKLNEDNASFALYHYAKPDDDRPLEALGQKITWTLDRKNLKNDADAEEHRVALSADVPDMDVRITKTFTLRRGDYHLGLEVKLERRGTSKDPVKFQYQLAGGHGLPIEGLWYTTIYHNALAGTLGERNVFLRDFQDSRHIDFKKGGDPVLAGDGRRILYAGTAIQYFASVMAVDDQPQRRNDFLLRARPTIEAELDPTRGYLDDINMRVVSKEIDLPPGDAPVVHKYLLYNGPIKVRLLADRSEGREPVDPELLKRYINTLHLDTLTDYHMQGTGPFVWISENITSNLGWTSIIIWCTNRMHDILAWLHSLVPNYGICIIFLTILVRGLMYPVSRRQQLASREMQAKMQVLSPELKKLKEKYKNDFRTFSREQHELYRRHNVNPLAGLGGCLPLVIQMPIFMGLYYALQESVHFRLAAFWPLWIKNLAAPDMLIWWSEKIPWISTPDNVGGFLYLGPWFNLLPVLAVVFMIVQQKMLMPPPTDETQEMQQKMMKYMMIFFGIMFYKVAAGLCVYFIVSSLWGLTERKMLPKPKLATAGAAPPTTPLQKVASRSKSFKGKAGQEDETNGTFKKIKDMWTEILKQAKKK